MRNALEHANISVGNVEETVRFLQAAFPDWKVRGTGREGGELKWLHIGTDNTYLALSPAESRARNAVSGGVGLNHLGFVVDDAEALKTRLLAAGYREGYKAPGHPNRRRVYFLDADGFEYEFVQYFSDDPKERNDYTK
ncbi:MAG: VOC family protein [Planctomycetes bacterium]|nr:VOC family protein [Planctomycetota bacterium]